MEISQFLGSSKKIIFRVYLCNPLRCYSYLKEFIGLLVAALID